jgi:two-component system, OmpR family, response regulator
MAKSILIIEDDKTLQRYLQDLLTENYYTTVTLDDGVNAVDVVERIRPDMVLLDLQLPMLKGESVCTQIKKSFPALPVTILTAKDSITDKVTGFELGADEYITKPFESAELLARIKARLRQPGTKDSKLAASDLTIDSESKEVTRNGKKINLTPQEYKLLEYLVANKGRVLSRDMLLNKIWPNSLDVETRVVDVYISYLRKKVDKSHKKKLIRCVRGFGYTIRE